MIGHSSNWYRAYLVAVFISGVGGSVYYTYSRPYLRDMLGETGYLVVNYLIAAESIPAILSIITGFLADRLGRRKVMLLGFINTLLYPY
ncbi:MAG: hypothetical protein ABWW65_05200 [Thermoprotei archaeon]